MADYLDGDFNLVDGGQGKTNPFSGVLAKLKGIKTPEFVRDFSFTKDGMSFQDSAWAFATFEEKSGVSIQDVMPTSIRYEEKSDKWSQVHYMHDLDGGGRQAGKVNFDTAEQGETFAQTLTAAVSTPGAVAGYSQIMEMKDTPSSWGKFIDFLKDAWTNQNGAKDLVQPKEPVEDTRSGPVYGPDDELVDELADILDDEDLDDLDWDALVDDLVDDGESVVEQAAEQETPENTSKVTHEEIEALLAPDQADDLDVPYFARKGPLAFFEDEADFQTARGILDKLAQEQPDLNMAQAYLTDDYKALSFPGDAQDYPIDLQGLSGRIFEKVMFAVQETLEVLRAGQSVGDRDPYEGLSEDEITSVDGTVVRDNAPKGDIFENAPDEVTVTSADYNLTVDTNLNKIGVRSSSESNYEARKEWAQMLRGYATSEPVGVEPSESLNGEARFYAESGENQVMQALEVKGHLYEHFSFAEDCGDEVVVHNRLTGEQHKVELAGCFNAADVAEVLNNNIHKDHYRRRDANKPNFEMG